MVEWMFEAGLKHMENSFGSAVPSRGSRCPVPVFRPGGQASHARRGPRPLHGLPRSF